MTLYCFGLNSQSTSLDEIETASQRLSHFLDQFKAPYVFLSTCQRLEVYISSYDDLRLLELSFHAYRKKSYTYSFSDAFRHLAKVTAGLDSLLLGETAVKSQVVKAYEQAKAKHNLPSSLHFAFQKALKISKTVRSNCMLDQVFQSLEDYVCNIVCGSFPKPKNIKTMLIGFSSVNQKLYHQLFLKNPNITFVSNHCPDTNVHCLSYNQIDQWVNYDLVIAAASASKALIHVDQSGCYRTKMMIDLGVPRNIKASELSQIKMFSLADIYQMASTEKRFSSSDLIAPLDLLDRQLSFYQDKLSTMYLQSQNQSLVSI